MNGELEQIERVDALDRQLARLAAEIARSKERLEQLSAAATSADQAFAAARAEVDRQKTEERSTQRKLDDLGASRKAALRVLETGIGNAEVAQRQLERCDQLIDETESAMLEVLEAQDRATSDLERAKTALEAAQAASEQGHREIPVAISAAEAEIAKHEAERQTAHAALASDLRSRYDSFRARGRYAVGRITSGGCDACGYAVQPQMLLELQRGRLVSCQGCHRWLLPAR